MTKRVILLTDDASVAPTLALVEVLREAKVMADVTDIRHHTNANGADRLPPLAVLYEVMAETSAMQLHGVIMHAAKVWPGAPLVACRHRASTETAHDAQMLDAAALERIGFRAAADEPTQIPAILRDLEMRGTTGALPALHVASDLFSEPDAFLLPGNLSKNSLRAASEVMASLHFASDQRGAAQTALVGLAQLVQAERWIIYLSGEMSGSVDTLALEPLAARGVLPSEREAVSVDDWRRRLMGDALTLNGTESKAARQAAATAEIVRKTENKRRIIAVPLIFGEKQLGVLEAVREGDAIKSFTQKDAALLQSLALPLACALANAVRIAEAERLSQTDDLTKLHNARYLRQFLLTEVRRARRYDSNLAAIFLDLDNFKRINDANGHLVGSHVLMETAAVILTCVRDTDIVARYGGDEFVVVLPETGTEQAWRVAERVRERIAQHDFTGGRRLRLRLTGSFGVAAFPENAQSPQQLIAAADTAMYEAKAANKNCIRTTSGFSPLLKDEKVISS